MPFLDQNDNGQDYKVMQSSETKLLVTQLTESCIVKLFLGVKEKIKVKFTKPYKVEDTKCLLTYRKFKFDDNILCGTVTCSLFV